MLLAALQKLLRFGRQVGLPVSDIVWDYWKDYSAKQIAVRQNSIGGYVDSWEDLQKSDVPYHRTFPIITESKIYSNMYLETLVIKEDIRLGINCIEVRCAFREYYPPTDIQIDTPEEGAKDQKWYYETWQDTDIMMRTKRTDLMLNFIWATRTVVKGYLTPDLQEKERNKYFIEGAILAATCVPFIVGL